MDSVGCLVFNLDIGGSDCVRGIRSLQPDDGDHFRIIGSEIVGRLKSKTEIGFAQNQLVNEIQETCAPRQRALLSLLAISQKHKLPPKQLVASFADDLPRTPLETRRRTRKFYWSRVHDFSEELKQAQSMPDSLEKFPGLLPGAVELALRLEREAGTLDEFTDAWLNRPPDYVYEATRSQTFVNSMFTLFFKTFVIFNLAIFIVIKVFPEFQSMMEEFGVEPPPIFDFTATIFDALAKLLVYSIFAIPDRDPFLHSCRVKVLQTLEPIRLAATNFASSVSTRQVLALVTAHGKSISANAL